MHRLQFVGGRGVTPQRWGIGYLLATDSGVVDCCNFVDTEGNKVGFMLDK